MKVIRTFLIIVVGCYAAIWIAMDITSEPYQPNSLKIQTSNETNDSKDTSLFLIDYYGGSHAFRPDLPSPSDGENLVHGYVEYHGQPAVGVRIRLMMNGKYLSEYAKTDEKGIATWKLGSGPWYLNLIETDGWDNKPQNNAKYLTITGMERKLNGKYISGSTPISKQGKPLLGSQYPNTDFSLEINETNEFIWPKFKTNPIADPSQSIIQWQKSYGSEQYLLTIWQQEGDSYDLIIEKTVSTTSFPLSRLSYSDSKDQVQEYLIVVKGFSTDGSVRSKSSQSISGPRFILKDKKIKYDVNDCSDN